MDHSVLRRFLVLITLVSTAWEVTADPNDWVNVDYIMQYSQNPPAGLENSRNSIITGAKVTAKSGPWTVTNLKGFVAPSGDPHDYLSWAPYHWPNCDWCSRGTNHLANNNATWSGNSSSDGQTSGNSTAGDSGSVPEYADPYSEEIVLHSPNDTDGGLVGRAVGSEKGRQGTNDIPAAHRRMRRVNSALYNRAGAPSASDTPAAVFTGTQVQAVAPSAPSVSSQFPPDDVPAPDPLDGGTTLSPAQPTAPAISNMIPGTQTAQTTDRVASGVSSQPQDAAKPTNKAVCTPSPTKSMAPSATWTTCPYIPRDGLVNPDVRNLNGPAALNDVSQSVLYNALAYAFQKTPSFSQSAASFINAFFLTASTKMNPNMNFGQLVRGPGPSGQIGTFTGILDARGMVKITNAIQVLKATKSPDWTSDVDGGMNTWVSQYSNWLQTSPLGKKTASRPNNHATFFVSQLSSLQLLSGDTAASKASLEGYFQKQFLDQIAASGEQPFEAVRTRPYHYRCFNLEAMITNAKLGDQLGLNLWTAKSHYGATIQTALDYTMGLNPGKEDVTEIAPHVAAIAAAYGDPQGKYAAFLKKIVSDYQSKSFWLYDQPSAFPNSPANQGQGTASQADEQIANQTVGDAGPQVLPDQTDQNSTTVPFQCPAIFDDAAEVEISDGIYATCDELKPFYELAGPASLGGV